MHFLGLNKLLSEATHLPPVQYHLLRLKLLFFTCPKYFPNGDTIFHDAYYLLLSGNIKSTSHQVPEIKSHDWLAYFISSVSLVLCIIHGISL